MGELQTAGKEITARRTKYTQEKQQKKRSQSGKKKKKKGSDVQRHKGNSKIKTVEKEIRYTAELALNRGEKNRGIGLLTGESRHNKGGSKNRLRISRKKIQREMKRSNCERLALFLASKSAKGLGGEPAWTQRKITVNF